MHAMRCTTHTAASSSGARGQGVAGRSPRRRGRERLVLLAFNAFFFSTQLDSEAEQACSLARVSWGLFS